MKKLLFNTTGVLALVLAILMLGLTVYSVNSFLKTFNTTPDVDYSDVKLEFNKKQETTKVGEEVKLTDIELRTVELIEEYDLQIENKEIIDGWVSAYKEEETQMDFINSMDNILKEQKALFAQDSASTLDVFDLINTHKDQYQKEFKELNNSGYEKTISQFSMGALGIISMLMFIIFMMVPVLISIEKNTRKE